MSEFDRATKENGDLSLAPGAANVTLTAVETAIIDTQGFDSLTYHIVTGAIVAGTGTITLEEGDEANLSDATDVPDGEVVHSDGSTGQGGLSFTGAASTGAFHVGSVGKHRFQRLTFDAAGTTGTYAVIAVKGHPRISPTE